jgi:hypothetical protein
MKKVAIKDINKEIESMVINNTEVEPLKEQISYEPQTDHLEVAKKAQEEKENKAHSKYDWVSSEKYTPTGELHSTKVEIKELSRNEDEVRMSYSVIIRHRNTTSTIEGTFDMPNYEDADFVTLHARAISRAMGEFAGIISIKEE